MKNSTKNGLTAAASIVLLFGPLSGKLMYKQIIGVPSNSAESSAVVDDRNYVDNFLGILEPTFAAGTKLEENRDLESSISAENLSSQSLLLIQLYMPEWGFARFQVCADYSRAAKRCLAGMELVQGSEYTSNKEYIDHFKKTIQYRIRVAHALASPSKEYQDLAKEIVEEMTWKCMSPDVFHWIKKDYPQLVPDKYANKTFSPHTSYDPLNLPKKQLLK